jgi:hypothetical protein
MLTTQSIQYQPHAVTGELPQDQSQKEQSHPLEERQIAIRDIIRPKERDRNNGS